jgi:hypothetical protein
MDFEQFMEKGQQMTGILYNKTLVIDLQYFPSIDYIYYLITHDKVLLEQFEHYEKGSFRNRCFLAGPGGRIRLTVPLEKGKHQHSIMKDVRISATYSWQKQHWKTLESAYRRSPWFEFYEPELLPIFEKKWDFLLDLNLESLVVILKWMEAANGATLTDSYVDHYDDNRYEDFRQRPGKSLLYPERHFRHRQVFEERTGYIGGLSILDLIFCEGKRAFSILMSK